MQNNGLNKVLFCKLPNNEGWSHIVHLKCAVINVISPRVVHTALYYGNNLIRLLSRSIFTFLFVSFNFPAFVLQRITFDSKNENHL